MKVTVVVTTRNSERTISACLASVRRQTHPSVELIVVDNRSEDATVAIAESFADIVTEAGPERSAQRNVGATEGTGSHLLFVDSDMVLERVVVEECARAASAGADAVVVAETSFGRTFWAHCKAFERSCYEGDPTIEAARFVARRTFDALGGFDEEITGFEDWDFHARLLAHRARIGRTSARIWHDEGDLRLRQILAKKSYYGRHLGRYYALHPERATTQLRVLRPAFLRHRRRLVRNPALATGVLVMKSGEAFAAAIGYARTWRAAREGRTPYDTAPPST